MFNGGQGWHNEWSLGPSQHNTPVIIRKVSGPSHLQSTHTCFLLNFATKIRSITLATVISPHSSTGSTSNEMSYKVPFHRCQARKNGCSSNSALNYSTMMLLDCCHHQIKRFFGLNWNLGLKRGKKVVAQLSSLGRVVGRRNSILGKTKLLDRSFTHCQRREFGGRTPW